MKLILIILIALISLTAHTPAYTPKKQPPRIDIDLFPNITPEYSAHKRTVHCLATMIYGEARSESKRGQIAVAYTAKNRAKNKESICKEIIKPYQYSVFNKNPKFKAIALDPSKAPPKTNAQEADSWEDAKIVAEQVYNGHVADPTNGATHYISPSLLKLQKYKTPVWAKKSNLLVTIEKHKFFKV